MKTVARFVILLVPRACIPVSFLLAIVFGPVRMLSAIPKWPRMLRDVWDDPL